MSVRKRRRYQNPERCKKVKQAKAELDQRIKETSAQFLKQRNKRIKETIIKFLKQGQGLFYLFLLLLLLPLIALGFTSSLLWLIILVALGLTFFSPLFKICLVVFPPLITRLSNFSWLSSHWTRWFNDNFDFTRKGDTSWTIDTKSGQGCFFLLILLLIIFGFTFFLLSRIYPTVFSTLIARLGIASWLGLPLLITTFFGSFINLPLFVLKARCHSEQQETLELLPLWLFKCWCFPSYKTRYQSPCYIWINVAGGIIPIILALYQVHRAQPLQILLVTAIVGLLSYFLVTVIPGRAIVIRELRFWLIAALAALSAMAFIAPGVNRIDTSVAFAGGVLGTTIGADLLHLKDVIRSEDAVNPLRIGSIGGAGLNDGIVQSGLYALIIAEWLPATIAWLLSYLQ